MAKPVEYLELEKVMNDCNTLNYGTTAFQYWQVPDTAGHRPPNEGHGVLVLIPQITTTSGDYNSQGRHFIQIFYGRTGNVWTRRHSYVTTQSPNVQWSEWKQLGAGNNQSDLSNFISTPESQIPVTDANNISKSGMYRTQESGGDAGAVKTANLPDNVSAWGVLLHFFENNKSATKAGFQLYSPTGEQGKGKLYFRSYAGNSPSKDDWKVIDVTQIAQMQDMVITAPTETLQDVNGTHDTGYYFTAPDATGMEGVPQDKRDGIVKIIKDEDGGVSIQEYTSSVQGDNNIYVRTIPINPPIARINGITQWQVLAKNFKSSNYLEIDKELIKIENVNLTPYFYAQLGDRIMYEFEFPNKIGLNSVASDIQGFVVVKTIIADEIVSDGSHNAEQRWGFITQYAYTRKGRVFVRWYEHPSENSRVDSNAQWTQPWKELKKGSGSIKDIGTLLNEEFTKWLGSGDTDEAEKTFKTFYNNFIEQKFQDWNLHPQGQDHSPERTAFDTYVKSIVPSGGTGIDFHEWIYHN